MFNHRSKSRYINLLKLKQKKFETTKVAKHPVAQLCDRFNELNMTSGEKSNQGREVVEFIKTHLMAIHQPSLYENSEEITDQLLQKLNLIQGRKCFEVLQRVSKEELSELQYLTLACDTCKLRLIFQKNRGKIGY